MEEKNGKFSSQQWTPLEIHIVLAPIWIWPVCLLAIMHTNAFCWRNAAWTITSSGFSGMGDTIKLSQLAILLCLRDALRWLQLTLSSAGLWRLQPWVWCFYLNSCFLATFKQSMKRRVENLTNQPPAINPSRWAVRLCKQLFFRVRKQSACSFLSVFQQQRLHITEGPFSYLAGLFLPLGEKSLIHTGNS